MKSSEVSSLLGTISKFKDLHGEIYIVIMKKAFKTNAKLQEGFYEINRPAQQLPQVHGPAYSKHQYKHLERRGFQLH